jgi:hypothetical protein
MPPMVGVAIGFMSSMPGDHDRQMREYRADDRHELWAKPHTEPSTTCVHVGLVRGFCQGLADDDAQVMPVRIATAKSAGTESVIGTWNGRPDQKQDDQRAAGRSPQAERAFVVF